MLVMTQEEWEETKGLVLDKLKELSDLRFEEWTSHDEIYTYTDVYNVLNKLRVQ